MVPRNGQDRSLQMGQGARPTGKTTVPMAPQTYVGDDACIVPGTLRRRERPRAGSIPPLQMAARPKATGKRRSPLPWQTPVGADSISARFAAARGSAGGACPSPANRGERPTKRDGPDHPGNCRAGCPHPAGPAASHGPAERSRPFPTNGAGRAANRENHGPYGTTNLCRGRCLHRPGDLAASRTSAGGISGLRAAAARRLTSETRLRAQ